jgi:tRNA (guanine-N7-)-methyltransferase
VSRPRRVRQHVNPLAFRLEVAPPDWTKVFPHPERSLEVDIGCGGGGFLLERARRAPDVNLVGLDIREAMAERARSGAAKERLSNVHVIWCSANAHFAQLFAPSTLDRIYVHMPDPWFKKKHHKRRVVTPEMVELFATRLKLGGEVHLATDHEVYGEDARELFERHPAFRNAHGPGAHAPGPLLDILSDRESRLVAKGGTVHRYRFVRV